MNEPTTQANPDHLIALICGGDGPEAEASRDSAEYVREMLGGSGYRCELVEIDAELPLKLAQRDYRLAIPLGHGVPGEDGTVQGLLDLLTIPYLGSGVSASVLAIRKDLTKIVLASVGIAVPWGVVLNENNHVKVTIEHALERFDSLVVKPVDGGSSMGVTRCLGVREALLAADDVLRRDGAVLVEEFIAGVELTVAIADVDGETLACPAIDVSTTMKRGLPPLSMRGGTRVWSSVGDDVPHVLDTALYVHNALGLRHFSRIDLIVDGDGRAVVLEANSIPGMSAAGLWRRSLNAGGVAAQSVLSDLAHLTVDSTSAST